MHILCIDVETTGQNRFKHWMPCFGACVMDELGHCPTDHQFLCYLAQPPNTGWDDSCVAQFWKCQKKAIDGQSLYERLLAEASKHGVWEPRVAMSRFLGWLKRMIGRYPSLQVVSDNPSYDIAWIDHYLQVYCPAAVNMSYCTGAWRPIIDARTYAMAKSARLESNQRNHNPLCDAMQIGREFVKLTAIYFPTLECKREQWAAF